MAASSPQHPSKQPCKMSPFSLPWSPPLPPPSMDPLVQPQPPPPPPPVAQCERILPLPCGIRRSKRLSPDEGRRELWGFRRASLFSCRLFLPRAHQAMVPPDWVTSLKVLGNKTDRNRTTNISGRLSTNGSAFDDDPLLSVAPLFTNSSGPDFPKRRTDLTFLQSKRGKSPPVSWRGGGGGGRQAGVHGRIAIKGPRRCLFHFTEMCLKYKKKGQAFSKRPKMGLLWMATASNEVFLTPPPPPSFLKSRQTSWAIINVHKL